MADNNKLSLVVEVDVNKANASIKSVNSGMSSIEEAAMKAARGASSGIDAMTASMIKAVTAGNLLADAIKNGVQWVKEWTTEAILHSAHTEKMSLSMAALARAHGVSGEAASKAVEAIKKVGFSTQDAIHAVDRLVIADMSLEKARGFAQIAKDAAAIEKITPGEALEKLMTAIESGQSKGLRSMGLFLDINKQVDRQEKLTGRTLSDNEVIRLRANAVETAAIGIHGASAAAAGNAEAQYREFTLQVDELKEAIGKQFQEEFVGVASVMKDSAHWATENAKSLAKVTESIIGLAAVLAGSALVKTVGGLAAGFEWLVAALNPVTIVLGTIAALLPNIREMWKGLKKEWQEDPFLSIFNAGAHQPGGTQYGQMEAAARAKMEAMRPSAPVLKAPIELDADRVALERKKRGDAERSAQELYMRALEERKGAEHDVARSRIEDSIKTIEATHSETEVLRGYMNAVVGSMKERAAGVAKINEEERREIQQRSTYTDEKTGAVRHFSLDPSTLVTIHKATVEKLAAFDMKFNEEEARRTEAIWKAFSTRLEHDLEIHNKPLVDRLAAYSRVREVVERGGDAELTYQRQAIEQRKDLELAGLDAVDARTLQQKVALENAKTAIEVQAMKARTAIELQEIDRRAAHDIEQERRAAIQRVDFDPANLKAITDKITQNADREKEALQTATTNSIDVEQAKGATATRKLVVDQYQTIFQSLKQQAGGVFDALLQKSQSVWSAIGNSLKTALLTAIKDVVTSRVAAMLMNMFVPGAHAQMQQGGMGGMGGKAGGWLGALGIGAVPAFAAGLGPGGTPPFLPSGSGGGFVTREGYATSQRMIFGDGSSQGLAGDTVYNGLWQKHGPGGTFGGGAGGDGAGGDGAGMGAATPAGGIFSKGGLAGMLPGLKSLFGFGQNQWTDLGGGRAATGDWIAQYGSMGDKLQALGKSNAAVMAGAGLLMDGLKRGGKLGIAEDAGGGALIGFKYGGPLGAIIGAIAGAAAGVVRTFIKSASDKAREKIKSLYGVDISDKQVLQQIVDTTKSGFGGNLDMAIRSPQIRDLIQLYAMTTGQKTTGMPASVTSLSLSESGGSLYQMPQYNNGIPLPALGGQMSFDNIAAGTPSNAGGLVIQLDGPATTALLQGQVVQTMATNSRAVQSATMTATKSNSGRRELTALQLSPGTLTS